MFKHIKYVCIIVIGILSNELSAQLWYNKGQQFFSGTNTLIRVQGSFMNDSFADSRHNGLIVIDSTLYNLHNSTQQGYGVYDVYKDWVNSANFSRDTSFVHLKGDKEYIEGDSATQFYNLAIEGSNRKIMRVNAFVYNFLYLNNLELATDQDTMFVENSDPAAIKGSIVFNGEGFISTLDSGCLMRKTNSTTSYYYPFGSIIGAARFRPLNIQPNDALVNYYACSFQNKNPNIDEYYTANKDSDVCVVNDRFYHTINRTVGNTPADITIGYLKSSDGAWNEIGFWSFLKNKWSNTKNGVPASINSYKAIQRLAWNNFSNKPYALINYMPLIDSVYGLNLICSVNTGTYTVKSNNTGSGLYKWSLTGGEFVGDSTQQSVIVKFLSPGTRTLFVSIVDTASGCTSGNYAKSITSAPGPFAGFSLSYLKLFKNTPITISDSSKNSVSWDWDFGNGKSSTQQNPQTAFDNSGTYLIKQIVTDAFGCKDSTIKTLEIKCDLQIPNVFTPNSDGNNDLFLINEMCISNYTLEIFDRWGLLVYLGYEGSSAWDGRTPSGEICPVGTYYYILTSTVGMSNEKNRGFITLLK